MFEKQTMSFNTTHDSRSRLGGKVTQKSALLAIVNRASTGRLLIVSSDPVNSMAWFNTSSLLKNEHKAITTSFPVTPFGRTPVNFTLAMGGICHHDFPVAQILKSPESECLLRDQVWVVK